MIIMKNANGTEYLINKVCGFNKADLEYYKNDMNNRVCAYALLTDFYGNCIVAQGLNMNDWNNGTYFQFGSTAENLAEAEKYFKEKVKEYLGE